MPTPQLTRRAEREAAGCARLARLITSLILALSAPVGLFPPLQHGGDGGGGLSPVRMAHASSLDLQPLVAAGYYHTCAIKSGALYCWGSNSDGQLGGSNLATNTPVQNMASGVTAVAAGGWHSAGLKQDGCLFAWGRNNHGQLGDGTTTNRSTPVQVSGGCGWQILPPPRVFIPVVMRP